jgi:cytosine/adenosine deaminase-related metal-dependent hydrolase
MQVRPLRLSARWALPVDAPPIPDAALLIGADGRIAAVGPEASVPSPEGAERLPLGDAVLLPGLVNTHTHLELSGLEGHTPDREFREWILGIRRLKEERTPDEFLAAARRGVRDCWAAGMTTLADTGDSGAVIAALAELGGSGIVYHEVFGPHPGQCEESFAGLRGRVAQLAPLAAGRVRLGVSPHAPYTVSGPLYSRVAAWARTEGLRTAVHIAESPEELEFVARAAGPFAEGWRGRGIPALDHPTQQPAGRGGAQPGSSVAWLDAHGVLGPDTLCIHAVQLSDADIALLGARGAAIAHCPRSNARHRHGAARLRALRAAGLRIGIGTDSVASVGRLDLFAEARAAQSLGGLDDRQALALGTLDGARALGLEGEIGSLSKGKWGDVIAIQSSRRPTVESPAGLVLASAPEDVILTVLGGRIVHRDAPA